MLIFDVFNCMILKAYLLTSMVLAVATAAAIDRDQAPEESDKKLMKRGLFNLGSGQSGGGGWLKSFPFFASSSSSNKHHDYETDHFPEYEHAEVVYVDNHLPSVVIGVDHHYEEPHLFEPAHHIEYLDDEHHYNDEADGLHHEYSNFGGDLSYFSKHAGILDVSHDSHGHELGLFYPHHTSYHH